MWEHLDIRFQDILLANKSGLGYGFCSRKAVSIKTHWQGPESWLSRYCRNRNGTNAVLISLF
jgi:hypothetical protein